jgi:cardiolipin synthase
MKPKRRHEIELDITRKRLIALVIFLGLAVTVLMALPSRGRQIAYPVTADYAITDPQFRRAVNALFGTAMVGGNRITVLQNGEQSFGAMLAAINAATKTITFETAYFRKGYMTRRFADALSSRARAGVKVHVDFDWAGTAKFDRSDLDAMKQAGVEVEIYHKPHFQTPRRNYTRSHRRILVVDGRIAFTGGICVADMWDGNAQDKDHWRDTQFQLEGPVVAQMQAAFMDNWRETRQTVMHDVRYFPPLDSVGPLPAQVVTSSPDENSENVRLVYMLALAAARHTIIVQNPYFVPDDVMRDALIAARRRGVDVQIMVPGPVMDAHVTAAASHSRFGPLLEAGVKLYEYQPTMMHQKIMIVDGVWVTAGSANFDNRSFRLNDEVNFNVYDSTFAATLTEAFLKDKAVSREYTLADWNNRPLKERIFQRIAATFRAQL